MIIKNALQNAYQKYSSLDKTDIDELLALSLHRNKEYIYAHPEHKFSLSSQKKFDNLLHKRLSGWSIAYLRGYKFFYGYKFLVNKYTLVPRPDSEVLVNEVLKVMKSDNKILDMGTGSGCLIISVAKANNNPTYVATDISKRALSVAKTNARKLKVKNIIKFIHSDQFENIKDKFDIIIANLPYLNQQQMKEPSIKKEPKSALLSGEDGLDHYRKFFDIILEYIKEKYHIFIEIDPSQKESVKKIISSALPHGKIEFIKDLSNNVRVVRISN